MDEIRIPPRHRKLNVGTVESLVKAVWYENIAEPPDKFVILVDTDGKTPDDALNLLRTELPSRLGCEIGERIRYAYAQWHLEAWYFADASSLREYLGQALGGVDTSKPDEIQNPKQHLRNLLGEQTYTALVSEDIARVLDARIIDQRSPSFRRFVEAIMNGGLGMGSGGG